MNLKLIRKSAKSEGIFSELRTEDEKLVAYSLEHAFAQEDGDGYKPKVPPGVYRCIRGTHRLHDLKPFDTFEVMKVPGATGILFHVGNYNKDSEGCILLGQGATETALVYSQRAFENFMELQARTTEFFLEVT